MPPTTAQLILLGFSVAFFAIGGAVSLARLWSQRPGLRIAAKACMYGGLVSAIGVLAWHAFSRGQWRPMEDNFDALIWLAVLLGLFVMYIQRVKPIGGLDWFIMPVVILLLVAAGLFGRLDYHAYKELGVGKNTWVWVHRVTAYGGAVAFAIAAAGGAMYVLARRRVRRKSLTGPNLGSLERLDHLMMTAVTLGFALLTVGLITGFVKMFEDNAQRMPVAKLLLASLAWLVYAVVMHAPFNPRFRGRRAALLSVFGFVLMIGTLVAVQFMPGGTR